MTKLNQSLNPDEVGFNHEVISSAQADLFRRKTDLDKKKTISKNSLFLEEPNGLDAIY